MNLKKVLFIFLILGESLFCFSQGTLFEKTYGYQDENKGGCIVQMPDSGYVIAGTMNHENADGIFDLILIKTDQNGCIQARKIFEDTVLYQVSGMIRCQNQDIALCGTLLKENLYQAFCMRVDSNFNVVFKYVTQQPGWTFGHKLIENKDLTIIVVGQTYNEQTFESDGMALRLTGEGELLKLKVSGFLGNDAYISLEQYQDQQIAVCGHKVLEQVDTSAFFGYMNLETLELEPIELNYILGKSIAYDLKKDYLGNFLICGSLIVTQPYHRQSYYLIRVNAYGNLLQYVFENDGEGLKDDIYYTMCIDAMNNVLVAGNFTSYTPYSSIHFHKFDENLSYLASHNRSSDLEETISQFIASNDGTYVGIGTTMAFGEHYKDIYLLKVADTLNPIKLPVIQEVSAKTNLSVNPEIRLYPNPVHQILHIENLTNQLITNIKLYEATGQLVKIYSKVETLGREAFDMSLLKAGLYFIEIQSGEKKKIQKVIKY